MKVRNSVVLAAAVVVTLAAGASRAQEVVLKIHHFLPPQATVQALVEQAVRLMPRSLWPSFIIWPYRTIRRLPRLPSSSPASAIP